MARTLDDDFEDDLPGGGLNLEKGSALGTGATSSYDAGGLDFDDDDAPVGASLELDLPKGPAPTPTAPSGPAGPDLGPPQTRPSGAMAAVRTTSSANLPAVRAASVPKMPAVVPPGPPSSSGRLRPVSPDPASAPALPAEPTPAQPPPPQAAPAEPQRPNAAAMVAKYPDPPAQVWLAPKYAILVLLRQFELRSDLESLRRRRSPDVPLYEAALKAYDTKTFRLGMVLTCSGLAIATILFFMPVILRFVRAD